MDLLKSTKEIEIEGKEYIMAFDMRSVGVFNKITGESFTNALPSLFAGDDFVLLGFMGATIRPKEKPDAPLGDEIYQKNILELLLTHGNTVTELIAESLPKQDKGKK